MSKKRRIARLATITLLLGSLLLYFRAAPFTSANENGPVNLSRSGAATAPVVVAEANGSLHVIWQDRFAGFVYTSGSGSNWAEPTAVTFPFSSPPFSTPASDNFSAMFTPRLLLDGQGIVHAFWRAEGALTYSNAPLVDLSNDAAWSTPQTLAASAPAYAVTVATDGRLHLAYVRTASSDEFPAGVYYRQRTDGNWSNAAQLYQSNYLRAATVEQLHVDIAAVGPDRIFVVWDNYLVDTVYYAQSSTGGSNWSGGVSIDQRDQDVGFDAPGPHYLQLIAHDGQLHFLWNRYSSASRCELNHRWSADGGREWQTRQVLFDGISCPLHRHALVDEATNRLYLLTEQEQGSTVIRAWLGSGWHSPQLRPGLVNFANPDTFRSVSLNCLRPVAVQEQLFVIGCGQGQVEDIWLMTGDLPDSARLEQGAEVRWQLPEAVARTTNEQFSPIVLSQEDGLFHLLWLEGESQSPAESLTVVRYAYGHGTSWSRPAPVVEGHIDQMVAGLTDDRRLLLFWRDLDVGTIWFSQVEVERAAFPAQWSPPKELVVDAPAVSHPTLLMGVENQLYLAYALTVNEGRGIYVRRSDDGGFTWSEPMLAFDAAAAGWPRIDTPSLALTADGSLHLMWGRYALLVDDQPTAYYYARSLDNGETWSAEPALVAEGPLGVGRVVAAPTGNDVLRLWQTKGSGHSALWYQLSENAGGTWRSAALIPSLDDLPGDITTLVDPAGRLHLLHIAPSGQADARLNGWIWQSDSWQTTEADALFELRPDGRGRHLSATILEDDTFLLVFSGLAVFENVESATAAGRLYYTSRPLTLPEERVSAAPALPEPSPEPAPLVDDTQAIDQEQTTPLSTPDLAALADAPSPRTQYGPIDTTTSTGRILVGVLPAGLVVVLGIALGLYALRTRER
jgi:hypothetical protein